MPPPARLLAGRRALVTGATTGIGRGAAFELAAHGAAVAIDYRGKEDEASEIVAAIEGAAGRSPCGWTSRRRTRSRVASGRRARRSEAVNLTGVFLASREAARIMRAGDVQGTIVMVSSVHEQIPWKTFSHYCASKGGMKPSPSRSRASSRRTASAWSRWRRRRREGDRVGGVGAGGLRHRHDAVVGGGMTLYPKFV